MEPQLPTVTVVIPNHNYEQWIKQAIESVDEQDYPAKSIVVIDDNSKDGSLNKIAECFYGESKAVGNNIIMGRTKNGTPITVVIMIKEGDDGYGPSVARNVAIKLAWQKTHIFMFLDADDYWLQGKISKSVTKIIEAPDKIGVVYTDNYGLNIHNGVLIREYRPSFDVNKLKRNCFVHSGSAVTKLAFETCGLYDETMRTAEDWHLWLRISKQFLIYRIPEPLVVARNGSYNSTNSVNTNIWKENWQKIGVLIKQLYG